MLGRTFSSWVAKWYGAVCFVFLLTAFVGRACAQGSAFSYQGRLNDGAGPANGLYDFRFRLAVDPLGNSYLGDSFLTNGVAVANGLFATTLDFGTAVFNGSSRWLEVNVRTNGALTYTVLNPLQPISPAPYAIFAGNAATASAVSGPVYASQLSGPIPATNLSGIVPLSRLSGITSNQIDPATWQFLVTLASSANTNRPSTNAVPTGMVLIPSGSFTMGDTLDGEEDAKPVAVALSSFYMDTNLVSYAAWTNVYTYAINRGYGFTHTGTGKAANHPVVDVSWLDAVKWCNARSQQAGLTPVYCTDAALTKVYTNGEPTEIYPNWSVKGFRLPTEAEWEFAARGGLVEQRFPWGMVISQYQANYKGAPDTYSYDLSPKGYNSKYATGDQPYTSPVGSFAANGYGLYDMAGNTWQWCWDWYGSTYSAGNNPRGATSGANRVVRGGSWYDYAFVSRSAARRYYFPSFSFPYYGFRAVSSLGQ